VLHKTHWARIRGDVYDMLDSLNPHFEWSKEYKQMLHPDEFIIPTFLFRHDCALECAQKPVFDKFHVSEDHGQEISLQDLYTVLGLQAESVPAQTLVSKILATSASSSSSSDTSQSSSRKRKMSAPKSWQQIQRAKEEKDIMCQTREFMGKAKVLGVRKVMRTQTSVLNYLHATLF